MNLSLKDHPFAVEAFFERSLVLTFAVPKEQLQPLLPQRLELDLLNNNIAFITVAMVQTKNLRPKGFPSFLGNDFFLIGYRIFVRYTDKRGRKLRGLYILKSETNRKKMELLGNVFTRYNYTTTDIDYKVVGEDTEIISNTSRFSVQLSKSNETSLPANSPFTDWAQARKYAGPMPFTFSINGNTVLIIEGVRQDWIPKPISVKNYHFAFLESLGINYTLANAFEITDVPYYWKKGKIEQW